MSLFFFIFHNTFLPSDLTASPSKDAEPSSKLSTAFSPQPVPLLNHPTPIS